MSLWAAFATGERAVASDEWPLAPARGKRVASKARHARIPDPSLSLGVKGRVGVVDGRGEFARGEGVEGAETRVEFGGGQAALAIERAEKIGGGTFSFLRIAFEAAGNEVAVGVAAGLDAGHDVVEALVAGVGALETIETVAAFAEVDGLAQGAGLEEVQLFQVDSGVQVGGRGRGGGSPT